MKYQIGNKVKVINKDDQYYHMVGIIKNVCVGLKYIEPYFVVFDKDKCEVYDEYELELVEVEE